MYWVKSSGLPFEDLSAVGLGIVGRSGLLPTKDMYQRRLKYRNLEVSVEYLPNMSWKACELRPKRPNQGNPARHVKAFRYHFGPNPHERLTCVAVAPLQVVEGVRA